MTKPKKPPVAVVREAIPKYITNAQACDVFGFSPGVLRDLKTRGLMIDGPTNRVIDFQRSANLYIANLREKAAGRATSTGKSLADARAEQSEVQTEIARIQLRKVRGEVIELAELIPSWTAFAGSVKAAMLALPGLFRAQIPQLTAHDEQTMKRIVRHRLADLAEEVDATVVGADSSKVKAK